MLLHGHVFTALDGAAGFDTNQKVSAGLAAAFHEHGYRFCVRYVRRKEAHTYDLDSAEAQAILESGLGLMLVQHVESDKKWSPSSAKGTEYGRVAAEEATKIGIPAGVTIWCDLEGVGQGTQAEEVLDYCNEWHSAVASAGYVPGLYVGWHSGLTPSQLYHSLRFTHYWGAYNLNADEVPIVRKLQMKQRECRPLDRVAGYKLDFQVDVIRTDGLGGRPTVLATESWFL